MRDAGLVLLAAGGSRRMGLPKQLLEIDGQAMLARSARDALASSCRPVVVVCGASFPEVSRTVAGLLIEVVHNDRWEEGIGTSIRAGIEAMSRYRVSGAVIALADQPLVDAAVYDGLVHTWRSDGVPVVASRYCDQLGVPALFDETMFPKLLDLPPDEGCKRLIATCPGEMLGVRDCPQAGIDVDTPEDLVRLRRHCATGRHVL